MRVLMTADTMGGVWTYAMQLARGLQKCDVEVVLATMGALPTEEQKGEAIACGNVSLCSSRYALEWMENPWADVDRASLWLLELESRLQPDVVHLNGYAHAALPWRAPKLVVCHSCVLSWWQAVKGCHAPLAQWGTYSWRVNAGLHSADFVVAPTRAMLGSINALYGNLSCPTAVIANAVDPAPFAAESKQPFIFSAGRLWDAGKNVHALLEAAGELAWPVYLAGDSSEIAGVDRGLSGNVEFLGQLSRSRVAGLLRAAGIYCLPARYEPFGLSVLEAAHAQCALVLGDIPSLRENWQGAAFFVAPKDVNELSGILDELIANPSLRQEYAQLAHARAQQFVPMKFAENYLTVYQAMGMPRVCEQTMRENTRCA